MTSPVDVVVIGAGVVGLSTAVQLSRQGVGVVVVDRSMTGGEGSRAAAGVAIPSLRLLADPPMRDFAAVGATHLDEAVAEWRETHDGLCRGDGVLRPAWTPAEQTELESLARRSPKALGDWLTVEQVMEREPVLRDSQILGAFAAASGYVVDAGLYLDLLGARCRQLGVELVLGEAVTSVRENSVVEVTTSGREWRADQVVVAAGAWSGQVPGLGALPVYPMRGQMVRFVGMGLSLRGIVSGRTYLCPSGSDGIVTGATEERAGFDNGVTVAGLAYLLGRAASRFPRTRTASVARTWSGLRSASPDGRPIIGRYPGMTRVLVGTGHGGQGILTGAYTGLLLADMCAGHRIDLPTELRSDRQPGPVR